MLFRFVLLILLFCKPFIASSADQSPHDLIPIVDYAEQNNWGANEDLSNRNLGSFKIILVRCLSNLTLIQDRVEKGLIEDEFSQVEMGVKFLSEGLNSTTLMSLPNSLLEENPKEYFEAFEKDKLEMETEFHKFLQIYESALAENADVFIADYIFCNKTFVDR